MQLANIHSLLLPNQRQRPRSKNPQNRPSSRLTNLAMPPLTSHRTSPKPKPTNQPLPPPFPATISTPAPIFQKPKTVRPAHCPPPPPHRTSRSASYICILVASAGRRPTRNPNRLGCVTSRTYASLIRRSRARTCSSATTMRSSIPARRSTRLSVARRRSNCRSRSG